jgi:hypothetical protein
MFKRLASVLMISVGVLLMLGSLYCWRVEHSDVASISLPKSLAGLPLSTANYGPDAVAEITSLHQKDFSLLSGAMGMYGTERQIAVWVARFSSSSTAAQMVSSMREKISAGNSPFSPTREQRIGARTIYELDGMGQKHFYFQSGDLVIWLSANIESADQGFNAILEFYP